MDVKYQLLYHNKRGGGEIIRLVFVTAGIKYEDSRLAPEQWSLLKQEMPMRALPCLKIISGEKCQTVCQSGAIAKYLARKFGLYPDSDDESLLIDEVYGSVGDVRTLITQIHLCKIESFKTEMKQKLIEDLLPRFASYFEKRICEFGENGYIVGSKITLADLAVFNLVDCCIEMGLESLWQPYPKLLQHRQHVMQIENIAHWLKIRPKTDV